MSIRNCIMPQCQTTAGCKCGSVPAWGQWLSNGIRVDQEELRIWRERYPRSAFNVREEAAAIVEGRSPNYLPPQIYGCR